MQQETELSLPTQRSRQAWEGRTQHSKTRIGGWRGVRLKTRKTDGSTSECVLRMRRQRPRGRDISAALRVQPSSSRGGPTQRRAVQEGGKEARSMNLKAGKHRKPYRIMQPSERSPRDSKSENKEGLAVKSAGTDK